MKPYKYLAGIIVSIFCLSCNSDEVICNPEEPDTPQTLCDTGLLIMRNEDQTGAGQTFFLDSIQKPVNTPLVFNNIYNEVQANFFGPFTRPSNYDTYNSINNTYFIEFPVQQRLFKYEIDTQTRSEFIISGFYAAPMFYNGTLYALEVDFSNFGYATDPAVFEMKTINQNDGSVISLTSGTFPLISSFDWESMSSAKDDNGILYFISHTNLITYNINTNTATHTELVPTFDVGTDYQRFYGLEMRNNGSLLALRERDNDTGEGLELVEIDSNNPIAAPTVVFDFMANGIELNSEFYSTTYDACDDTYYITSRDVNNVSTTNFYKIDLANSTYITENFPYYLMGIETKNQ